MLSLLPAANYAVAPSSARALHRHIF